MIHPHRVIGAALLLLSTVPFYRLLDAERAGMPGSVTRSIAEGAMAFTWLGTVVVAIVALAAGMLSPVPAVSRAAARLHGALLRPSVVAFSASAALLAALLAAAFTLGVLDALPNHGDAIAQLLHARYLADGQLAGPTSEMQPFWHIPNTVATTDGWVSQYPPAHTLLLAAGLALGAVWIIPALVTGCTVFLTGLVAHHLFAGDPFVARLGTLLLALSLFFIGLAGAYMNHATAAAFIGFALYAALRARDRPHVGWPLLAGGALALAFATRPLSALVAGVLVLVAHARGAERNRVARFVAIATIGAAPALALLMLYNAHFFGGPLRLGYAAGTGASTGLGFGIDPWGNHYGPVEAIGYTSADLATLNLFLNEWPIPVVALVGAFLLLRPRLDRATWTVVVWALLPVAANAFYWHHGQFMGPRMLAEFAPGWALLLGCALAGTWRMLPAPKEREPAGFAPRRAFLVGITTAALAGFAYLAPLRIALYADVFFPGTRAELPAVDAPALVFVHEPVGARVGMRLAARGMPMDSIERAMNARSICDMIVVARLYPAERAKTMLSAPADPAAVERVEISPGLFVRLPRDGRVDPECATELRADRAGGVDLLTRVWRGALPNLEGGHGAMFVRDYGPVENQRLIQRFPDRVPLVLARPVHDQEPRLMNYDEGMRPWQP